MKKILALVACLSLVASLAIGGSIAYLTDRDTAVNVFTMGNVDIDIIESYKQDSNLFPGLEVPKKADIKNTHLTTPAYVWMVVSVPKALDTHITLGWADGYNPETVDSPHGDEYSAWLVKYPNVLKAGESTGNLLNSVTMSEKIDYQDGKYVVVNNGVAEDLDPINTKKIIVDAYAIQTEGFKDFEEAYDAYTDQWDGLANGGESGVEAIDPNAIIVKNQDELQAAINAATEDTTIILSSDITGDITVTQKSGVAITILGEGETFKGSLLIDGGSAGINTAGLTIKNLHFAAESFGTDKNGKPIDACIRLGLSGDSNTRYTRNVTVSGCTFDVPGMVGIKSYTGGDKFLTVTNCTATKKAHSLINVANVEEGLLIEDCTVNSVNGLNLNSSYNVTIDNCDIDVEKYAVRFGAGTKPDTEKYAETYLIKDSTLKSSYTNADSDDAVIVIRGTADYSTLTIENTTIEGVDGKDDILDITVDHQVTIKM